LLYIHTSFTAMNKT